jgi:hypothetical protein
VDVFAYEYSGYGHATGEPSELNIYSNARAALTLLSDGFGLKPERDIILFGEDGAVEKTGNEKRREICDQAGRASGSRRAGVVLTYSDKWGTNELTGRDSVRVAPRTPD